MYKGLRILALIPARGGSKGIKNKNIIDLHGKPLIYYTIHSALGSKYIDKTIVSTDSEEIARVSREFGADIPFMRPDYLATDTSKTVDVVMHTLDYYRSMGEHYDVLVLLQPTEPLRDEVDIDGSIELFYEKGQRGLVSVSLVNDHPILIRSINENSELTSLLDIESTCRRQDMPSFYRVNGCIYINKISDISNRTSFNDNPIGYIMDDSHSIDIDEMKDLVLAEYILNTL